MKITDTIRYVGVHDDKIDLFEGQYKVPDGISYNSYLIRDSKIAVMDSVDEHFADIWIENIKKESGGKNPDYLIVSHMEPDHSSSICHFKDAFPDAKIVSSNKAFAMMRGFFGRDFESQGITVSEGDTLPLGEHTLTFITAPMVHWPEVIMTYELKDKVLFSADGFGTFGKTDAPLQDWADEAARYYIGIVGKYGAQVQAVLKKAAALDISVICPLHGPILCENLEKYITLYDLWSRYAPEKDGVLIAYTSVYGNTKKAAKLLYENIKQNGKDALLCDLARCDMSKAIADAFRFDTVVFATTTYNGDVFPYMREFIHGLTERSFQQRTVAFIENGSWAPIATKVMKGMLEKSKNLTYAKTDVKIMSAINQQTAQSIQNLAYELCNN